MAFTDIHIHALWGVDDGAKDRSQTLKMLDAAYADGTRCICLTPHCHPGYFGNNGQKITEHFEELKAVAAERYPGLELYLGNELRYSRDCVSWLEDGICRCLGDTGYVLVDFHEDERAAVIVHGLSRLLNAGYTPVLAHAERYAKLSMDLKELRSCRSDGVLIQIDSQSLFGQFGFRAKWIAKGLLRGRMVDFVGSDAHDCRSRVPGLSQAYHYISKLCGQSYADAVCRGNGLRLLKNDTLRKDD